MSENKTSWASMETVADMLVTAANVSHIAFYTNKRENGPTELNSRCFGLPGMSKAEVEALACELNVAIAPVLRSLQSSLQSKAANQLRRFL